MSSSSSSLLRCAVLLLSWLAVVVAQTVPNSSLPYAVFHTGQDTLALRGYPECSYNVHSVISNHSSPNAFYSIGGLVAPYAGGAGWACCQGFITSMDYSSSPSLVYPAATTFTPTAFNWAVGTNYSGANPIARGAGGSVVMPSGAVLVLAGKVSPSYLWMNDVLYSTNQGQSWNLATFAAPWPARSDLSVAVAPGTNNIVLTGGQNAVGFFNDVWLSQDGVGAVWIQQPLAPYVAFQQAPLCFLYDSSAVSSSYSNPNSTLVLYDPYSDTVYTSTNLGYSWVATSSLASFGFEIQQAGRMASDLDNYLYMAGGIYVGATTQTYFSKNKGVTWGVLTQVPFYPGLRIYDPITINDFIVGCLAINYVPSPLAPNGFNKQLIVFGGFIAGVQNINTFLGCQTTSGLASYTSVTAELVFPGETVAAFSGEWSQASSGASNALNVSMIFHDAANQLIFRSYSDWTYDNHAAITHNSTVRMWQFGGYTSPYAQQGAWLYIPTTDFTATGSWNQFTTFQATYNMAGAGYAAPSGRVALGAVLLYNGNLLFMGGKDSNTSFWVNDVYWSSNNGYTLNWATATPGWSQRSDFSFCSMPGTNTVVIGGGQVAPYGYNVQDFWYSTDGYGRTWTQGSTSWAAGVFQDAPMIAMYDNKFVSSGSNQFSTLFINPGTIVPQNADGIWSSTNAGASWSFVRTAPWSQRIRHSFVSDMENYLYMMGGTQSTYGDIWLSTDFAQTWGLVPQIASSTVWPNTMTFQQAQQNCMALRYIANPNSPNGYHKQIVLFGGPADPPTGLTSLVMSQQPASSCTRTISANVAYAEVMFPSELSNPAFNDTTASAAPTNLPVIAWNNPTALLSYRAYATCAADVHAIINGNTPNSYALGGWDANGLALYSVDVIPGSNINGYTYVNPLWGVEYSAVGGRVASMASVLGNGNLIWGGGKVGMFETYQNDIWYSVNQARNFSLATQAAAWPVRSDAAMAPIPGTNCVIITGGQGQQIVGGVLTGAIFFNDVWSSCDGIGAIWTLQAATAPFIVAQQSAIVALYDNTGSTTAPTSTILFYNLNDQFIRSSNNLGQTWTTLGEAVWNQRQAKFVADLQNNVYMPGGFNNDGEGANDYDNGVGDSWFSANKGLTWNRLTQSTTIGYANAVTLSNAAYSCATLVPGVSPHKQIIVYANWVEVYSGASSSFSQQTDSWGAPLMCVCNSLNGIRGVIADLIFPGEVPNNLPSSGSSSSSSSSTSYSPGQTAGIAIGVGVGCLLLCCLLGLFLFSSGFAAGKGSGSTDKTANHARMENEPSHSTAPDNVEMRAVTQ